jgi:hypothetical protein
VTGAKAGEQSLRVDEKGTVDLSALKGTTKIRFAVTKS